MSKKKSKKRSVPVSEPATPAKPAKEAKTRGGAGRLVAIGLLALGIGFFAYAMFTEAPPASSSSTVASSNAQGREARNDPGQTKRFRYFEDPAEAYPLPATLAPTKFQNQGIANTYRIAKDIPEILAQQPCLCGCDNASDDHRSLLDCYRDEHASHCLVCMKEAVLAERMTKAGKSAQEIRDAILRHDFSEVPIGN